MTTHDHIWAQKEGVSGKKHFYCFPLYGIRSFHASFHHFSFCFYKREIHRKASNGREKEAKDRDRDKISKKDHIIM